MNAGKNFKKIKNFGPEDDLVIHGAGQDMNEESPEDFMDYWNSVDGFKPLLYMAYSEIRYSDNEWFTELMSRMREFPGVILQLGISMTDEYSKSKNSGYEKRVLRGEYDENIRILGKNLKRLGKPVFLRLGYEFNAVNSNGYEPENYIRAYKYVFNRVNNENIMWVWNACTEGCEDYMKYYPGDEFVDWWSLNIFSRKDMDSEFTKSFLERAEMHENPVMIGEACPARIGTKNKRVWSEWFKPFFKFIHSNRIIKSFCYVNLDWTKYERFPDWKDCRISNNSEIRNKYLRELENKRILNNR